MPITIGHNLTATTPDNPAYEIRPSHWNDTHAVTFSPTGVEILPAFSNENNVSFSTNGAGLIVASANVTAAPSPVNITGANGSSVNAQTIAFSNANGMTLGVSTAANGATVTGSYTVPTQSVQTQNMVSVQGSTGNISFANGNGITFGGNASTITASHNGLTTARASNDGIGLNTALTAGPLAWTANSSGLSLNAGSVAGTTSGFAGNLISGLMTHNTAGLNLSLNHPAWLTTARASNDAIGTNTAQSNVTWTANSAGLSLDARGYAGTGTSATNASVTLNSNGIAISVAAGGGVNPVASASNGSFSFTTLAFSNANNVTFGTSAGSIITASVAAPGAAAENNWVNLLGANTEGNTTASGSTIGYSGINLTLSGTNGSVVNISAPATSSLVGTNGISISTNGSTVSISYVPSVNSRFVNEPSLTQVGNAQGNSLVSVVPFILQNYLDMSNLRIGISGSGQTTTNNSTNMVAGSVSAVLYSRNGSSLSSMLSASNTYTATWTSNGTGTAAGARALTMDWNNTTRLAPGEYWVAAHMSTATSAFNTSGTSNLTYVISMMVGATAGSAALGLDPFGQGTQATRGASIGLGIISTGNTLGSIPFSSITQSGTRAMAAKLWMDFRNYSVW